MPPTNEKVQPGGDTTEKKEGEPPTALFTVNPFLGGHYKQLRFNHLDPDTLEWQKPKNEFSQPNIEDFNLNARIISGKIQGGAPLSIPMCYDWTIDLDSLIINAPEGRAEILRSQDGLWYLNVKDEGVFRYEIRVAKKQRVSEEPKLEKAEISGDLPLELKEKIDELKKKNFPKLKLKREIAKVIHYGLKYATSDELNSYYKEDPLRVFEKIWQRKEANCYWTHVLGARALAEVDDEWSFISGFLVKEKDEQGNAIMHAGNGHSWLEIWDKMSKRAILIDMTPRGDPNVDEKQQEKDLEGETGEGDYGESDEELASENEIKKKIEEMQKSQSKQENDKEKLFADVEKIKMFLKYRLFLELPEEKTIFRKFGWGIDFCGCIVLPNAILLRDRTKGRMFEKIEIVFRKLEFEKISRQNFQKTLDSYFGLLSHCKSYNVRNKIKNTYLYSDINSNEFFPRAYARGFGNAVKSLPWRT